MSNVLLGMIGLALFIGLALVGASYYGSYLSGTRVQAEAANYMNQGSQISRAIEMYMIDNGRPPFNGTEQPVDILVAEKYMKAKPPGGSSPWILDAGSQAILTPVRGDLAEATKICVAARERSGMTTPATIKKCDGSSGALAKNDPCCLL